MRIRPALLVAVLAGAALPVLAQAPAGMEYDVRIDKEQVFAAFRQPPGKPAALYVTVQFKLARAADGRLVADIGADDRIVVEEDGRPVADFDLSAPRANALTTVLAMDISGSMAGNHKIDEARHAGGVFLDRLDPRADCGLILFDHKLRVTEKPVRDAARRAEHRDRLRREVQAAKPMGGTAYLKATDEAIELLRDVPGRRAVLLMTDGVDLNSEGVTLADVIKKAHAQDVAVYTLGVGEPGRNEPVTTVLVLDHSGSMAAPADDKDEVSKVVALRRAAGRFVDIMRPGARTTLLPFSTRVEPAEPFSNDKAALKRRIDRLEADGGTLLYDATYDALLTLQAERPAGKRAVVVLTDGVDEAPGSRHRVEELVAEAQRAQVPLYMLGLGRPGEINDAVMKHLAESTGGKYFHASNQQQLFDIFEQLSIDLHDEGIDEAALKKLAEKTGGKYYPARDVSRLHLIFGELAEELQTTWTVTFASRRSSHDGTARGIDVSVSRGGARVSTVGSADYSVHGVVVPELSSRVYLGFLALVGLLLGVPTGLRRLYRFYGGT
jgi:Mg-chelatase subunit ChlD